MPRPPFQITRLARCKFGSKIAEFDLEITGVVNLKCDVFHPDGRAPFIQPGSVRDKFSGGWVRKTWLDREFAAEVLEAVVARLEADDTPDAT